MKRIIIILLVSISTYTATTAQITYSEHIAPIIYENCASCHREGEIGPFPLTNYEEVSNWSGMVKYTTQIKYMPPWKPDLTYSKFVGEKGLTEEEIQLIADWVDAGSPQGDPTLEPPLPDFPSGSQLGTPDLVLEMAEVYNIEGNNQDDYRVFVLPTGLAEDQEIAAIEFRPGNTKAVHHALIAYETRGGAARKDAQTPEYGYESFGGFGIAIEGTFDGYTPGIQSLFFPTGLGKTLPAGADIVLQVHYAPLASDETDQSKLNIFFKKENDPIQREVQNMPVTPFDLDGGFSSFVIPPNEVVSFHGTKEIDEDISLLSVYPHSHYLGKNWELFAETPENDTINIIRINDWDFNWQGTYNFDRMKRIPAGSIIHINATYDNTTDNPFNPNNPPVTARWGEGTEDEMYLVGTSYVPYQEGDENVELGGGTVTITHEVISKSGDRLYLPFPNPSNDEVVLNYFLNETQELSIELLDFNGQLVKTIVQLGKYVAGNHKVEFDVAQLPSGIYTIRMQNTRMVLTRSLIVVQ